MTDRDRLVEVIQRINWSAKSADVADALLAAGVTLPPQPAGPVTSEEARLMGYHIFSALYRDTAEQRRHMDTELLPLLARDHGLLTPAEVERRAREWLARHEGVFWAELPKADSLVAALTAPAATGTGVGK